LTKKERAAGLLDSHHEYRLPADHEWSCAIGIGEEEQASASPREKDGKVQDFPWDASGKKWPPPRGAGNYSGDEIKGFLNRLLGKIDGYQDSHPFTAPVGSFSENGLGLFDLSGNVWEWCEDWYDNEEKSRVLRGGSWYNDVPEYLRSSYRGFHSPGYRNDYYCFRCVVGAVGRLSAR
jgi:formylglycine-generating enzyme required for sulfatase activity